MRILTKAVGTLAVLGLLVSTCPELRAQSANASSDAASKAELSQRVEELEKLVEKLQGELSDVKKQLGETSPSAAANSATESDPAAAPAPAVAAAPTATAAPAEPAASNPLEHITVSGFVDGYYGYNFQHPQGAAASVPAGNTGSQLTGFRAFTAPTEALSLNLAELTLAKTPEATNSRLGFNLTLGFGNAMNVVNSTDPAGLGFAQYLKERYLSYLAPVGKGLEVDFGKFVTPHGAEVIESKDNWNYSRGLLFTYAIPFYHFGLRSKYAFNDKYNVSAFLVNGWNDIVDNNSGKTVGIQFGWNPTKKIGFVQNYMVGPEEPNNNLNKRQLWDTILTYTVTPKLSLMWNFDYGRGDRMAGVANPVWWSGIAGYVRYAINEQNAVAARYEYYNDPFGFTTGNAQHLNEFTTTFERIVAKHLITRLEFRRDMSNQPSLLKGSLPVKDQNTVEAGLVYAFDLREGH
jgi:Putative beta-barrel porin-2, OmpL-like. bbp2